RVMARRTMEVLQRPCFQGQARFPMGWSLTYRRAWHRTTPGRLNVPNPHPRTAQGYIICRAWRRKGYRATFLAMHLGAVHGVRSVEGRAPCPRAGGNEIRRV